MSLEVLANAAVGMAALNNQSCCGFHILKDPLGRGYHWIVNADERSYTRKYYKLRRDAQKEAMTFCGLSPAERAVDHGLWMDIWENRK